MQEDLPTSWADAADDILPVLRRVTDPPAAVRAEILGNSLRLLARPVGDFLEHRLVFNGPSQMTYLNASHLERWGVGAQQCFEVAADILDPTFGLSVLAPGVWRLDTGDGYESSRPLIPGWLRAFQPHCEGEPVVFIPHIRCVLVADSASTDSLLAAWSLTARGFETEANPVSPRAYVEAPPGGLRPWIPLEHHPLAGSLLDAYRRLNAYEYNNQRYVLNSETHALAKVSAVWLPGRRRLQTVCWWSEDTPELLAQVDCLGLRTRAGEAIVVPGRRLFRP